LSAIFGVLVLFRNTCAHNDRLYNYKSNRGELPSLPLHKELCLAKSTNNNFSQGKRDLFAVVIALRYLLEDVHFTLFFNKLENVIKSHPNNLIFPNSDLIKSMGFPENWREIATLPI